MRNVVFEYLFTIGLSMFVMTLGYTADRLGGRGGPEGNRQGHTNFEGRTKGMERDQVNPNREVRRNRNNNNLQANPNRQINRNWNNNNMQANPNRQVNRNWGNNNLEANPNRVNRNWNNNNINNINNNDVYLNNGTNAVIYGGSALYPAYYAAPYYDTTYTTTTTYTHCVWIEAHYDDFGNWIPAHQECT